MNTTQADQHKRSTASAAHFLTYPKAWGWAGTQTAPGMISPHHSERSTQSNWMSYQDMFERPSRLQTQTHHVEKQARHQLISTTGTQALWETHTLFWTRSTNVLECGWPFRVYWDPTSLLTSLQIIPRWPISRICVCGNSIDKNSDPQFKNEIPKYWN